MDYSMLIAGTAVMIFLAGVILFGLRLQGSLLSGERPCHRCGAMARFVDDRVESQGVAGLVVIERYECPTCGHEQHRLTQDDGCIDRI